MALLRKEFHHATFAKVWASLTWNRCRSNDLDATFGTKDLKPGWLDFNQLFFWGGEGQFWAGVIPLIHLEPVNLTFWVELVSFFCWKDTLQHHLYRNNQSRWQSPLAKKRFYGKLQHLHSRCYCWWKKFLNQLFFLLFIPPFTESLLHPSRPCRISSNKTILQPGIIIDCMRNSIVSNIIILSKCIISSSTISKFAPLDISYEVLDIHPDWRIGDSSWTSPWWPERFIA